MFNKWKIKKACLVSSRLKLKLMLFMKLNSIANIKKTMKIKKPALVRQAFKT